MKPSLRVYLVEDHGGLLTGRVMARTHSRKRFMAAGQDEAQVLAQLDAQLDAWCRDQHGDLAPFLWTTEVRTAHVQVDVRPQTTIQSNTVVGKERVPLQVIYAWAKLDSESSKTQQQAAPFKGQSSPGYRIMLPRFGWSMIVEELAMAPEVLREAIGMALIGETPRSLFEFRESKREYVIEWSPKWRTRHGTRSDEPDYFTNVRQVAEDWVALARAGKLGTHIDLTASSGSAYALRLNRDLRQTALLRAERKPSLVIVGPAGVGKTEWVRQLARRAVRLDDDDSSPDARVWATSAERIMAGMQYLGMWEQRCLDVVDELTGEGHFLYVDRLSALLAERSGSSSIADLFQTALEARDIALIAECTPDEYERFQSRHAAFMACFQVIRLSEPEPELVVQMLNEYLQRKRPTLSLQPEAARRLTRYLSLFRKDHAFPGKAFGFLDWLLQTREQRERSPITDAQQNNRPSDTAPVETLGPADADQLFSDYSGLPKKLISDDQLADVATLAADLSAGVIGQATACELAASVLARFKAGVNDPEKPIGSLLFVGPTGVGKTELAKQLARVVFGSADRMVRLDMSEYLLPSSVGRLLADSRASRSLVQQIRQQPLSVILLDEIEKAHPAVFDVLLGMLGEGRLTSSSGQLVDFRMTLVLMTSNLGVGEAPVGFGRNASSASDFLSAVRQHFRPEFFNRLDHVVPFGSLSPQALRQIVELELSKVSQRSGLVRRQLRLLVSEAAKQKLVELGWDAKYGARPLKRVIEERVLSPIAVQLSQRPKLSQRDIRVDCEGDQLYVSL